MVSIAKSVSLVCYPRRFGIPGNLCDLFRLHLNRTSGSIWNRVISLYEKKRFFPLRVATDAFGSGVKRISNSWTRGRKSNVPSVFLHSLLQHTSDSNSQGLLRCLIYQSASRYCYSSYAFKVAHLRKISSRKYTEFRIKSQKRKKWIHGE
jgi:hypothetical protein